jgi:2-oxoglutarate dehydrogenase E2 component (dihydrolipoamide succinyltransferase)
VADIVAPANAEGTKATILKWCKAVGESVLKDEPLIELETDKVTVEIASPATGRLVEIVRQPEQEVTPGDVLGRISAGHADDSVERTAAAGTPPVAVIAGDTQQLRGTSRQSLSPSVRRLLAQHELAPDTISGSGRNGRITAQDVMRQAEKALSQVVPASRPSVERGQAHAAPEVSMPVHAASGTRVPHTPIRRRIAQHMARSLLEAPHVTTLFEADLTRVLAHRASHAADYQARGARLTLTAYIVSACAHALRAIPQVNATFHSDALELHADANIGVGTALGNKGLIVPVIHRAHTLDLFSIARRLGQVVEAARAGRLTPEEVRGGTFTISNHGVGGSLLAAPIVINQPQVAILGMGKVQRRVCAVQIEGAEAIGVRSMCYLTLTIDHRALDAFQANSFLSSVVDTLDNWSAENPR